MVPILIAEGEVLVCKKDKEDGEQGRSGGCSMFIDPTPYEKCESGEVNRCTRTTAQDESHALLVMPVQE